MQNKPLIIVLLIVSAVGLFFYMFHADTEKYFNTAPASQSPKIELTDAIISGWSSGEKQWEFFAKKIYLTTDRGKSIFRDIKGGAVFVGNTPSFLIEAGEIQLDMRHHDFSARGDILITTSDRSQVIHARDLVWKEKDQKLTSTEGIWMKNKNSIITIKRLIVDLNKGELSLEDTTVEGRL